MIKDYHPVVQALLGTLLTWGLTAAGAALVFIFPRAQRKILDGSLGFAAGVMTAASYWSLLAPAIEMAEASGSYGEKGQWAFIPAAVGFILGAAFVYGADVMLPYLGIHDATMALALESSPKIDKDQEHLPVRESSVDHVDITIAGKGTNKGKEKADGRSTTAQRRRPLGQQSNNNDFLNTGTDYLPTEDGNKPVNWKRILLLIIAITIHNIPEGLAVGVGFGAIGRSASATFESARNLAIGIGIQNFPEGLAVSVPLRGSGMSVWRSFWYGQLSGMVEPIAGLLGAAAVVLASPLLPYALAFAAGAMIYVVVDDIIPEAQTCGNGKITSWGAVAGFIVMMSLDVGLG